MRPLHCWWTLTTKGILWRSARRIAALYGPQVGPHNHAPTSRLRLVNHLQEEAQREIWFGWERNPAVYWNKSSHGACCNGETGVTPSGAGRRRLDSASVTLYWSQYAGDTKWTLMTKHRWNSTYDTKWHSSASDQGLITRNCSLIQERQTLMEVMLRLISVSPLMFDIIQKTLPHHILESFGHTSLVKWKFIAMLLLLNSFQCWHDLKHIC